MNADPWVCDECGTAQSGGRCAECGGKRKDVKR